MPAKRDTAELLAAYVDGVGEMTVEERRRVERYLAGTPGARDEQAATRDLIDQLRELPQEPANEPDWAAMERAIHEEVGDEVPRRRWFARWKLALPAFALAGAAAAVVVLRDQPKTEDEVVPFVFVPPEAPKPEATDERVAIYLDGTDLELAIEDADLADDELDALTFAGLDETDLAGGLLETTDFGLIDDLDDEELSRAEQLLDRPLAKRKGS